MGGFRSYGSQGRGRQGVGKLKEFRRFFVREVVFFELNRFFVRKVVFFELDWIF